MSENNIIPAMERKLHRSTTDSLAAGVLGGIAETYGWNATILRLLFVASFLLPGSQFVLVLLYIAAAVIMPKQ